MDSRASNDVKNDLKESMTVHESEMDVSGHHHPELTPALEAGKSCREGNSGGYYCLFWVGGKNTYTNAQRCILYVVKFTVRK